MAAGAFATALVLISAFAAWSFASAANRNAPSIAEWCNPSSEADPEGGSNAPGHHYGHRPAAA